MHMKPSNPQFDSSELPSRWTVKELSAFTASRSHQNIVLLSNKKHRSAVNRASYVGLNHVDSSDLCQ